MIVAGALATGAASAYAEVKVVATTEDLAAITQEVGGDKVSVEALARGYQDPHFVEAKPSFILKLHAAQLLVAVGRELEIGWLPPLIVQSRNAAIQPGGRGYLDASLNVRILDIPDGPGDAGDGRRPPAGEPALLAGSGERPAHCAGRAAEAVGAEPRVMRRTSRSAMPTSTSGSAEAEKRWDAVMAPYKGTKIVTYHRSWPNFAERFGLDVIGYVEPKPGIPPSPGHTLELMQEMKRQNVKIIAVEPYFDLKTPNAVARDTGATVLVLSPSVGGVKEASTYIARVRLQHQPARLRNQADGGRPVIDPVVLQFLAAPFAASLILTGIHAYLGVHVVERGVIFVDLSLAQIAALGATIALLLPFSGGDPHAPSVYWVSLAFTFVGAAVFSSIHSNNKARIPQEAIIGICYAVASAAAIVAMSKSTSQAEHLQDMLVGNILAVSWHDVVKTALLYGAVGAFHYVFRRRFLLISMDPAAAAAQGISVRLWDFLFYASFGFVVTSSVSVAGVLLVFCYLIVPSVAAMLYAETIGKRLAIGWSMGTLVSLLGIGLSLYWDLPTGATIVVTFGGVLLVMAAARPLLIRR